jgi:hypothetical protein
MMMRMWATVFVCLSAGACQQPDWPAVSVPEVGSEITTSDVDVIFAGLRHALVAPYIERGSKPRSPIPPFVVADLTLRICAPPEWDYNCVPRRDVLDGLALDRNRRSFRINKTLGPGVLLAPAEEIIGWLHERGWRNRFQSRYPGNRGPVFVTAPVYLDGGKALLYVLDYGLTAAWLELTFDGGQWAVTRTLGGWQV